MKILVVAHSRKECEALARLIIESTGDETVLSVGKNTTEDLIKKNADIGASVIKPPVLGDTGELITAIHKSLATLPIVVMMKDSLQGVPESVKFIPPDSREDLLTALGSM